jgi:two-component system, chemotaxis family, response regulator Rcp1
MMDGIEVLLVEDNRSDIILFQEALAQAGISYAMHYAKDGVMAMDFLRRQGAFASAPRPALIVLDLNLPRMDGREVLTRVMADDDLRRIPLVVLTSSIMDRDIIEVFGLPEERFIIKPMLFNDLVEITRAIEALRVAAALPE